MIAINHIADAEEIALDSGWISAPVISGLYVSAGQDTKPLTLLHPQHLARQGAENILAPNFIVYVDKAVPAKGEASLSFEDAHTRIETVSSVEAMLGQQPAYLLRVALHSDQLTDREVAILRVKMLNDQLAKRALAEEWRPEWFIGVCDGCRYGGNRRCENSVVRQRVPIPIRLGCRYWVTDHIPGSGAPRSRQGGRNDLVNGQEFFLPGRHGRLRLRQLAYVGGGWRSAFFTRERMYGGARVFELEPRDQLSL